MKVSKSPLLVMGFLLAGALLTLAVVWALPKPDTATVSEVTIDEPAIPEDRGQETFRVEPVIPEDRGQETSRFLSGEGHVQLS